MIKQLHELLDSEPFVPFRIVLTSGKEYPISNPHLVAFGESQITVYTPKSDHWAILRLNQIASVETVQAA